MNDAVCEDHSSKFMATAFTGNKQSIFETFLIVSDISPGSTYEPTSRAL